MSGKEWPADSSHMEKSITVEPGHALAQRRIWFITVYPVGVDFGMMFNRKMIRQAVDNTIVWYDKVYRYGDGACPGDYVDLGSSHGEVYSSVLYVLIGSLCIVNAQTEVYATDNCHPECSDVYFMLCPTAECIDGWRLKKLVWMRCPLRYKFRYRKARQFSVIHSGWQRL